MRLCYLISQYPAVSHTFVQREILALRKLGWEITTISIRRANSKELLTEADRAEAARTRVLLPANPVALLASLSPLFTRPGRFFAALATAWHLRRPGLRGALWCLFYFIEALLVHRIAREQGIAHFHTHFANVACDVAMLAAVLGGGGGSDPRATFSFTMHGPTEFFEVAAHRLGEKTRAAKFVICISDFARSQLMPLVAPAHWEKLHVVHCAVEPAQFSQVLPRQNSRVKTLLTIARLSPVKGHAVLFRAVDELVLRGHDVALTLAGEGPLRKELEQLADECGLRSRVKFLGNVGQDRVPQLLAESDVFVLPSFAEGVPVVLMEAMAAGRPVVATRINGIPELIEDNHNGLLVPPGRVDLLANAIERLLYAPALAQRLAMEARLKIEVDFNLARTSVRLSSIFKHHLLPRRIEVQGRDRAAKSVLASPNEAPLSQRTRTKERT